MPGINPFAGVGKAKTFESGNYLKPGKYRLAVTKMLLKDTEKSGLAFITEFKVKESNNLKDHPIGSSATFFQKLENKTVAQSALKEFMLKLLRIDVKDEDQVAQFESEIDTTMLEATEEPGTMFEDTEIVVECFMVKTKKGLDFTKHRWHSVDSEDAEIE